MAQVRFGAALLFTDASDLALPPGVRQVEIAPLTSSEAYSRFVLRELAPWIVTSHCLIVQWDGFIVNPYLWDERFLAYDYIGASWPQFTDGHDIGNGGFSLRSRRLLQACRLPAFLHDGEAEDLAICRTNRTMLEESHALRFADQAMADRFAAERRSRVSDAFGFHGAFNLIDAVGPRAAGKIFCKLDHRTSLQVDFWSILFKLLHRGAIGAAMDFAFAQSKTPPSNQTANTHAS